MQSIHFTRRVGTAPGTITLTMDGLGQQCPPALKPGDIMRGSGYFTAPLPTRASGGRKAEFFIPYATPVNVNGISGLGIIDETDWWRTGHSHGLPGTRALFTRGGKPSPQGVGVPIRIPSYITGQVFPPGYNALGGIGDLGMSEGQSALAYFLAGGATATLIALGVKFFRRR